MAPGSAISRRLIGLALFALMSPAVAAAQDSLQAAQTLYASAAYAEALAVLDRLQQQTLPPSATRDVQQNRALCLLALGRTGDAEAAITAVVTADPEYRPSDANESPRVLSAFKDVRSRLLPGLIAARYSEARAAYDHKEWSDAEKGFGLVVTLSGDPDLNDADVKAAQDYKVLADGFEKLAAAAVAAAQAPAPVPVPAPVQAAPAAVAAAMDVPAPAPPAAPLVNYNAVFDASAPGVSTPVTVRQDLPRWVPDGRPMPKIGLVEIIVGVDGAVERAVVTQTMTPTFDRQIVEAARNWRYQPAQLDGHAVRFRKTIRIAFQ